MRLICPNCGAQYQISDDVIPSSGRDVQCSNCGHTWFETPGASESEERLATAAAAVPTEPEPAPEPTPNPPPAPQREEIAEPDVEPEVEVEAEDEAEPEVEDEPEGEDEAEPEVEPEGEDNAEDEAVDAPEPAPEQPSEPQQRELDPGVADILRQEAEFEEQARSAEADPLESQPDLGLSEENDEDRRSREARERLARLRGEEPDSGMTSAATAGAAAAVAATVAQAAEAPRRDLLPDIEEINSTLRPDSNPGEATSFPDDEAPARSGFRRGFMWVVLLALVALAVYVFADQITAAVPALEGAITSYVAWVDGLRIWLDGQVQGFIEGNGDAPVEAPTETPTETPAETPAEQTSDG